MFKYKKDNNHFVIYIFGIKISIKYNAHYSKQKFYKYLSKYKYVIKKCKNTETSSLYKNTIWQMWLQGNNESTTPQIVKKCMESVKYFCKDRNIVILDYENLHKYVEIPEFILEKHKKGIISCAHLSDYVRCCLLSKYGGTWIDATVLLTDKLPDIITSQDLFFFKNLGWYKNKYKREIFKIYTTGLTKCVENFLYDELPSISNWFIHSSPNNRIINYIKKFLYEYWKSENILKNYFMFHIFTRYCILNDKKSNEIWGKMYTITNDIPHYLQFSFEDEYNEEQFNNIIKISPIHKLTYKNLEKMNKEWIDKILNLDFSKL